MTAEEVLEMVENRRCEIAFYNDDIEGRFAVRVLDRLIEDIKDKL